MNFLAWLCVGVLGIVAVPAFGCLEERGRDPVMLPMCDGGRAATILDRALRDTALASPLRIEMIDDGRQTNFALRGTRSCEGSVTSQGGEHYTGTWSYTRVDDNTFQVEFSLQPSQ